MGKFYVKLKKDESYGLWGNFKIGYTDNELAQVDRGLYGANLHYQTLGTTSFGEKRFMIDGFAAEPGTVAGREEFRGTGGSLYYLRHQDILTGSERVRIEVRDKDSGIVLAVKNLTPVTRLRHRLPPGPRAADAAAVGDGGRRPAGEQRTDQRESGLPGGRATNLPRASTTRIAMAMGGRAHYWFNDYVRVGVTARPR